MNQFVIGLRYIRRW